MNETEYKGWRIVAHSISPNVLVFGMHDPEGKYHGSRLNVDTCKELIDKWIETR